MPACHDTVPAVTADVTCGESLRHAPGAQRPPRNEVPVVGPQEHGAHDSIIYDRNVLYDEVWAEPMRDVAKQHGVCGVKNPPQRSVRFSPEAFEPRS